jgi:hypothetical protein
MGYRGKLEEESIVRTGQSSLVRISVYTHEIEEELIIARHFVLMIINALMEKEMRMGGRENLLGDTSISPERHMIPTPH